ncbi:MAG TPA: cyclase family protein [archaeon]|nr:cyclase family protein [archaeon]
MIFEPTEIFDISVILGEEEPVYPGDSPYSRELVSSFDEGALTQVSRISMSAHSGTHIDLPSHFIREEKTIEKYEAGDFILPAQVVQIEDPSAVRPDELVKKGIKPELAILLKTTNSLKGLVCTGCFSTHYVYLTPEAAAFCVEKAARLVGLDYYSVDRYSGQNYPAHRILLKNNILILEGINLSAVPEGEYTLICFPLKIKGGEASPVRAVLVR